MRPTTSAIGSIRSPSPTAERLYLRRALPRLVAIWRDRHDPDLVAELCTCLRYLASRAIPPMPRALGDLLEQQNADGSWGSYEAARARLGDLVKQGFYLHTTMVAIEALSLGFDGALRRDEAPECP